MKEKIKPTDEQIYAIDCAKNLDSLKIEAFAGAAKTTTLKMITDSMPNKGLYLAFNKDIVGSANFKSHIEAKTFHSYAFRDIGSNFGSRLSQRLYGSIVAEKLKLKDYSSRHKANWVGSYLLTVIEVFCKTIDPLLTEKHFPIPSDIIDPLINTKLMRDQLAQKYLPAAIKLWHLMSDLNSDFPSRHSIYAKLWVMGNPKLDFDYIMMDEAQDMDILMSKLLEAQNCPIFYVGDRYQSIYGWRGAINAMEKIDTKYHAHLTMSFRFGQRVADISNMILSKEFNETKLLRGNPIVDTKINAQETPTAILCRTNSMVARVLLDRIEDGHTDISSTGTQDAIEFFESVKLLKTTQHAKGKYRLFRSYEELEHYSDTIDGRDLKSYTNMENKYGYTKVLESLNFVKANLSGSKLVISTAHRAKGLEWDHVELAPDFKAPSDKGYTDEETRLLYVAITRAKKSINIQNIQTILDEIETGEVQKKNNDFTEVIRQEEENPFIILLTVPFMEKDRAKALGARWNPDEKKCWITRNMDQKPFKKWII